jgi:hypothetical protein
MMTFNTFTKKWRLLTFIAWFLGVFLIILLSNVLEFFNLTGYQFYLGLGMGIGIGALQAILIKKLSLNPFKWFIITSFGLGLPFLFVDLATLFFNLNIPMEVKMLIAIVLSSSTTAILQSNFLGYYIHNKKRWFIKTILSWTISVVLVAATSKITVVKPVIDNVLILAFLNLLLILTGGYLLGFTTSKEFNPQSFDEPIH